MSTKDYDVIIIGACPSGLSSVIEATKNGAKTLILDKRSVIGEPTRTSDGTWKDYLEAYPFSKNGNLRMKNLRVKNK
jgi:digeranylgeranylglycerophospholipid reductase